MADSEGKYILRTFDLKQAKTGFQCAMITGSYSSGSIISLDNPSIKTIGVVSVLYGDDCMLGDYSFDRTGVCTTQDYQQYRLMLIEGKSETISEASLEAIVEALDKINTTLELYVSSVDNRLKGLENATEELERTAEDLDQRVTALEEEN